MQQGIGTSVFLYGEKLPDLDHPFLFHEEWQNYHIFYYARKLVPSDSLEPEYSLCQPHLTCFLVQ